MIEILVENIYHKLFLALQTSTTIKVFNLSWSL